MTTNTHPRPLDVLIAGGGVAALETMMALRALAGDRVQITLLAPDDDFHYRPMAVAEPFTIAHAMRVPLARITADFDARLIAGSLVAVEAERHEAITDTGERIDYETLVVACGTRVRPAFERVITIDDRTLGETMRGLVQDVEEGYTHNIAFIAPAQTLWPLPLYELALQTARRAYDMNAEVAISLVTPEGAPLAMFGTAVSDELSRLLQSAGIVFHGSSHAELEHGALRLRPSGVSLHPERIVALPVLEGPRLPGLPTDREGFISVSELGEVRGVDGVFAAGDATTYPIKQGGIAAQQADVVAAAIAARAGAGVLPGPLDPVLRGLLLTGGPKLFLEARPTAQGGFRSIVSDTCPWDPPTKIAALHLGRYLADAERHAFNA